jgi:hypothetical protein
MIEWLIDEMKEWMGGSMEVIRWTISWHGKQHGTELHHLIAWKTKTFDG